jgi:HEAT repeat protein
VAQEAVPSLTILVQQPLDDYRFRWVVGTLGEIGPDAASAVPALIGLLARDPPTLKISVRHAIFESLAMMGSAARPAVPALLSELRNIRRHRNSTPRDERDQIQGLWIAIRALALIGGKDPEVLAALRTQLRSDNDRASSVAFDALLELSPESPDLLAEFLNRRQVSNNPGRASGIFAISRMTCDRRDAIGPLTDALRDEDPEIRKLAAWVLGTLGSEAGAALPALHDALSDWQNSLYAPRSAMHVSRDNTIRDEIHDWSRSRILRSVFVTHFEELPQFEASSVRDLVREAILKIDPKADLQDGTQR